MTHLHITSPAIQIEMEILYFPKLGKFILDFLFSGLLMHIGDQHDPPLDG